jgi:hypothetical protein
MNQTPAGVNSAEVRTWAIANGWPQLEGRNGRLPRHAIESYVSAHGITVPPVAADDGTVMPPPTQGDA